MSKKIEDREITVKISELINIFNICWYAMDPKYFFSFLEMKSKDD